MTRVYIACKKNHAGVRLLHRHLVLFFLVCVLVGVCCFGFFVLFGLWRIGAGGEKLIEPEADI